MRRIIAFFLPQIKTLEKQLEILDLKSLGIDFECLTEDEVRALFSYSEKQCIPGDSCIDTGSEVVGITKLVDLKPQSIPENFLTLARESFPKPYEIVLTLKRIPEFNLELKLKHDESAAGSLKLLNQDKYERILDAKTRLNNQEAFFYIEFSVRLKRFSKELLRSDLGRVERIVSALGRSTVETLGIYQSFTTTLPGASQHVPLIESEGLVPILAPLVTRGNSFRSNEFKKGSLALHRADGSLFFFHPYGSKKNNANMLIVGEPNSGKSSFLSLKTSALMQDENQVFLKGDVGSSYENECRKFQGDMYELSTSQPSGLNPFSVLSESNHDLYNCSVLAAFLQILILERDESRLTKDMSSDVEKSILAYSERREQNPSIDDFLSVTKDFPREKILRRWAQGGIYENFLKPIENKKNKSRYRYYNLKSIEQVEDTDFMQGAWAALLSDYNLEISRRGHEKRINLEIDEAKDAINRCGPLLMLKQANNRKQGGSITLVIQKSSWIQFKNEGHDHGDDGLSDLADTHCLFTVDGNEADYMRRHRLTRYHYELIKNFKRDSKLQRQMLISDSSGRMVTTLTLSPRERWTLGSNKLTNEAIDRLLKSVPGLTEDQAISCLSKDIS